MKELKPKLKEANPKDKVITTKKNKKVYEYVDVDDTLSLFT